jgi:hypothetical protein
MNSRATITIGMNDVPWLDEETIQEIINSTPPHLRDAVKNGTPSLGSGAIYPIPLDEVVLKQSDVEKLRPLPAHFRYLYGMDVGWNKTAVVFLALDPDTDVMYVTDEYYQGKLEPEIHAARITQKATWMPGVIDPASRGRSQVDGQSLLRIYRTLGLKLREANNEVEAGIYKVWSRLSAGKLKFFPNTFNLQNEYLLYRRDEEGKIVKEHDHALDALRYAINTFQMAAPMPAKNVSTTVGSRKYNV